MIIFKPHPGQFSHLKILNIVTSRNSLKDNKFIDFENQEVNTFWGCIVQQTALNLRHLIKTGILEYNLWMVFWVIWANVPIPENWDLCHFQAKGYYFAGTMTLPREMVILYGQMQGFNVASRSLQPLRGKPQVRDKSGSPGNLVSAGQDPFLQLHDSLSSI